jgi:hypothetical protein
MTMPSKRSLKKLNAERRRREEQSRRKQERTRFLPSDLADEILAAAGRERAAVLARMKEIDETMETLEQRLRDARKQYRRALDVRRPPVQVRTRVDGSTYEVEPRPVAVKGPAAVEASAIVRGIQQRIAAYQQERQGRRNELRDILRVERAARHGMVSGVLAITRDWRNRVDLGEIASQVPLGRSFVDVAGHPLPSGMTPEDVQALKDVELRVESSPLEIPVGE